MKKKKERNYANGIKSIPHKFNGVLLSTIKVGTHHGLHFISLSQSRPFQSLVISGSDITFYTIGIRKMSNFIWFFLIQNIKYIKNWCVMFKRKRKKKICNQVRVSG